MERLTVSLDDYIKYLIKKWKIIIACVVIFVVLFAVSSVVLDEKIVIPPSDEYSELIEQEASFELYMEESPLMQIKSQNVYECIVYVSNIAERASLKSHVDAGYVWNEFDDDIFKKYFSDLVTWYDVGNNSAEIKVQYYEELQCEKISMYLSNQIKVFDEQLEVLQGDICIVSDEQIYDVQQWYKNRLKAVQGQLEYAATGYTITVSLPVAVLFGGFSGIFTSFLMLFLCFVFDKKRMLS